MTDGYGWLKKAFITKLAVKSPEFVMGPLATKKVGFENLFWDGKLPVVNLR
jgi:hypothetical protein